MKALIVYKSIHHGNTKKVAEAMAQAIGAELAEPEGLSAERIAGYDLVGFGSGIYAFRHHAALLSLVDALPAIPTRAFIFSTSGGILPGKRFHSELRKRLEAKGFEVVGEFNCPGFDSYSVLKLIGGINKGRPNEADLEKARAFAKGLTQ
jgi:flavodoxin